MGGETGMGIEFEMYEVRICDGVGDKGTSSRCRGICCSRVPGSAMGVEVSHDDVVTTELE